LDFHEDNSAALSEKRKDAVCVSEAEGDSFEMEKANMTFLMQWEDCLALGEIHFPFSKVM
jgi:hypothetical protein